MFQKYLVFLIFIVFGDYKNALQVDSWLSAPQLHKPSIIQIQFQMQ